MGRRATGELERTAGAPAHAPDARPTVAIVAFSPTPYRVHLHRRIAREIPELRLLSVFTHEFDTAPWRVDLPPEINAVCIGPGDRAADCYRPRYALREWRKGARLINALASKNVRAVVMCGFKDPARLRTMRWIRSRNIPYFVSADANIRLDTVSGLRARLKMATYGRFVRAAAGVMPFGANGAAYFQKYGAHPDRVFSFPLEPDYALIEGLSPSSIEQTRARFALATGRRRIVFSGRLIQLKRVDLLIRAFAAIADERPDWDLVILGDGPLRDQLQALVPERLRRRVLWTGFLADQAQVSAVYRACDLLVLCSDFDQWGLVINEGAAAGLAIVCSDVVGAAGELVRDAENGGVFARGDLASLTDVLRRSTNPAAIDTLRAGSRRLLAAWRRGGDPVAGLRAALASVGLPTQAVDAAGPNRPQTSSYG